MLKFRSSQFNVCKHAIRSFIAILCSLVLMPGEALFAATPQQSESTQEAATKLPPEQLDSLVAPIALYPDPLLSQTLVASTYPLEVIQLQQWLAKNKGLKDKALADAVKKENWDPSIQATAALPDVVKQLAENIKWTTDLGNAVLAQQDEVMDAVQRMRAKAKGNGNLKSGEQQKVETKVVESKQVIVIEQSNPEVIYVPSYNPTVVYGAPVYPYPPIVYPPVGYYAAGMALSFGVGLAMGAAWGGGWGYNNNWGGGNNNININNNNNFVNNSNRQNVQGGNRAQAKGGNSSWQHNPQHRGGAPYGDRGTANKYGGSARGDSMQNRQSNARQQGGAGNRGGASAGTMDRGASRNASAKDRGGASAGTMDRGGNRGGSGGSGGGDRVGNRSVPSSSGSRGSSGSAFGGGSSGSSARASSSRGSSSMGGGGGRSGGGGGRSGGGGRRR
jgi:hypothetical protein